MGHNNLRVQRIDLFQNVQRLCFLKKYRYTAREDAMEIDLGRVG